MAQKEFRNLPQAAQRSTEVVQCIRRVDDTASLGVYKSIQGGFDKITGAGRIKDAFNRVGKVGKPYDSYESRVIIPLATSVTAGIAEFVNLILRSNDQFMDYWDSLLPLAIINVAYLQGQSLFAKGKLLHDNPNARLPSPQGRKT